MRAGPGTQLALGLMSGTSADGVSLALVRWGPGRAARVLAHETRPYPAGLRRRLLEAPRAGAAGLCRLNFDLGRVFARAARSFLARAGVCAGRLAAVGSHGHTIIHLPEGPGPATLQLGEPSFLAEALGAPVVSDFRPRDMAAGGQGAPLVPFLDEWLFGDGPPRALQNIGGIANVALVGRGTRLVAFDTGPGNCLMDLAVSASSGGRLRCDLDGRWARRGSPDRGVAARAARDPYFLRRPPKSLDRGAYGEAYLRRRFGALGRRPYDLLATLNLFTALTIAEAFRRFVLTRARPVEMVVSGGGALNPVLMDNLRRAIDPVPIRPLSDYGMPALAKEPAAMALMALRAVRGLPNHSPDATGAAGPRVLGKITPSLGGSPAGRRHRRAGHQYYPQGSAGRLRLCGAAPGGPLGRDAGAVREARR